MKTANKTAAKGAVSNSGSPDADFPGTGVGAIPDATTTGTYGVPLVVSFNVSGVTQAISGVSVDVTMTHTWIGDLDVVLAAPGGSPSIPLFSRVGAVTDTSAGDSSNLGGNYVFNDSATANIWTVATAAACGSDCIITPGGYRTTAAGGAGQVNPAPFTNLTATFSSLTAAQANGTWTLTFRDRATSDVGTVTAANLQILTGGPTPTPPVTPTPTPTPVPGAFQDGGFEQNTGSPVVTNPFWSSTSTAFTSSLCTVAACGNGAGTAGPRTGNGWVWFDGASDTATAPEQGTVSQTAIIPVGATTLSYYLRIGRTNAPNASTLTVSVDGTVLQTINEPSAPETAYTERTVNISAFANGASHTILFSYNRPGANGDSFTIDDVAIVGGVGPTPTPTATPTATPTPTTPTPTPGGTSTAGYSILALTANNQLIRFNSNYAGTPIGNPVTITGLAAGENIVGIDIRPTTGQLYALSSASRLYTINPVNGVVTNVGTSGSFTLSGTSFGFDFNPTVDRIRVVSNTGQNLRLNPNDGTLTANDPALNGAATGADAAAYTNSFSFSTATTLYDISSTTDTLYTQNPANAGTLVSVGALGVNITAVNGFDIANAGNVALGAFQVDGATASGLYRVNLTTGAATLISSIGSANPIRGLAILSGSPATNILDFNGDRRADFAIARRIGGVNNVYYTDSLGIGADQEGSDGGPAYTGVNYAVFGLAADIFTPGDYDGDGRADLAVWRPSNGTFYVLQSSTNTTVSFAFGQNGDVPVARDYDGDGKTDYAVGRPAGGTLTWYYRSSLTGAISGVQFGAATDIVAPGDYDGDGRFDLAVYRGATGQPATFYVLRSTAGFTALQFGIGGDKVVPGDYDGDGRTDYAVIRTTGSSFAWYIQRSATNTFTGVTFGASTHLPVQNDYDGDGKTDVAVWNPGNGYYYVVQSSNGVTTQTPFGQNGDYPIANYDTH